LEEGCKLGRGGGLACVPPPTQFPNSFLLFSSVEHLL
jgi:hypothetical protein